ncbi:hypothetical protein, partial [Streptomyces alkaliphilus]|uniref:hypothetical protein n=1 Tax=Streptomyces alkaliphilus TaxID=1472722 RepID=UPI001E654C60
PSTPFAHLEPMQTTPPGEPEPILCGASAGEWGNETATVAGYGTPVIRRTSTNEPVSALDRLVATGRIHRAIDPGVLPEPIDNRTELPSLTELLIAERDEERLR